MVNNSTIGVAITTCNRPDFFKDCLESLEIVKDDIDYLVIIDDGEQPIEFNTTIPYKYIKHDKNLGISRTKNDAFIALLETGCEYLFVIEDDVKIIHKDCLRKYVELSKATKIQHLIFGDINNKENTTNINVTQVKLASAALQSSNSETILMDISTCYSCILYVYS